MTSQTITKSFVDSLKPSAAEYTVWDAKLPGFGVRVRPTGAMSFIIVYRAGSGRRAPSRRFTLGAVGKLAPDAARAQAKTMLGSIANGADPAGDKKLGRSAETPITFEEMASLYIELYAKPNKSSWKNDQGYLKRPRAKWGDWNAADITDDHVADLLDDIADTAPVSANRTQSVLHTLFAWGKEPGRKYVKTNPLTDMKRRSSEKARERVLSDDEIRTLWVGLDDPKLPASRSVALALKFILATMVRPGQAAGALASEIVDLNADIPLFHIPRSRVKRRREVIVPLSDIARSIVGEAFKIDKQVAVFFSPENKTEPLSRSALSAALTGKPATKKTAARVGIREHLKMEHFTPHDLRRTAATIARRAGAKRDDVKAMLDHLESDVTAVYDKYDMLDEKRAVARLLSGELRKILGLGVGARPTLQLVEGVKAEAAA